MNLATIAAASQRAQAAYIDAPEKARAAFEALGLCFIDLYQNASHQAALSQSADGKLFLSISGTRFSQGKIGDLFDDMDLAPVDVGMGAQVTRGAYEGLSDMWQWALDTAPAESVFNVEGHSLGGWRATYTPLFIPVRRIGMLHAFEPPKGANAAYYARFQTELAGLVIVGQGRDIWFGYPRLGEWIHRPGPMLWIKSSGYSVIDTQDWPGGLNLADHSIDLAAQRLVALSETATQ
ncbi:hypothetical protein [Paraburkholderia rhynchosiae]|uniref:Fungal lipase-like domain-containing protein n=1 Tax=Paraburkholderia rhynchosiae TaxID=487049 RepID=A0A2N7W9E2_9BURK|nr:hypothetical protein [Paraburkholderia rhynchosiae]PMS26021.1 hypothetical protein C0Z16_28210 [Paraburkholderia rhynchosiae]CAB3731276.1 hypothetical protein LMG27174_05822 [Paraburkholderia rhynchosiae]